MNTTPEAPSQQDATQEGQFRTVRELDPVLVQQFQERIKEEQNLPVGVAAGAVAALLGSILWGIISFATSYQIGWMAIGVAFMVGWSLRRFGKGIDKIFGIAGALLALGSCVAGNFLMIAAVVAREYEVSLLDVLLTMLLNPAMDLELLAATFSPIDLLFYGFAIYYGYKYSFRQFTAQELEGLYRTKTIVV
jgi:hypothetical protein